jgi:hypothetical protein
VPDLTEKLCGCGCGWPAPIASKTYSAKGHVKGQPVRYISGHNPKPHNGGLWINSKGRVIVEGRDGSKTVFARIIMENQIGRPLMDEEEVHHKDENPLNNDPDNLVLFDNHKEHLRIAHGSQSR